MSTANESDADRLDASSLIGIVGAFALSATAIYIHGFERSSGLLVGGFFSMTDYARISMQWIPPTVFPIMFTFSSSIATRLLESEKFSWMYLAATLAWGVCAYVVLVRGTPVDGGSSTVSIACTFGAFLLYSAALYSIRLRAKQWATLLIVAGSMALMSYGNGHRSGLRAGSSTPEDEVRMESRSIRGSVFLVLENFVLVRLRSGGVVAVPIDDVEEILMVRRRRSSR